MSPPTIRINTFVKESEKPHIDPVSKIYIVLEVMFGLDRLPLIGKNKFIHVFVSFMIFICLYGTILYLSAIANVIDINNVMLITTLLRNFISTVLSFTRCKWMERYYSELNKFDMEAGCRPKVLKRSICNVVMAGFVCILIVIVHLSAHHDGFLTPGLLYLILIHMLNVLEVYYFGHLLILVTPRLKLINYYMEFSLSSFSSESSRFQNEYLFMKSYDANIAQCHMRKLMDLYQVLVDAYDFLIEGIKWQLLAVIIAAFITVLGFLYEYTMKVIHTGEIITPNSIVQLGVISVIMIPLFSPCTASDLVHSEVIKLRELLASRLYENKLDKSGRSVARALLAFTETRDLSFRLLRMLNIDISLPFKFVGLLVTYLIILLQFEKVLTTVTE